MIEYRWADGKYERFRTLIVELIAVAAAHATHGNVMVAGVAGLVAGAMSMAVR